MSFLRRLKSRILGLETRRFTLCPADLAARRGDQVLLVWGRVPHWIVVDTEAHELLTGLERGSTLGEIFARQPGLRQQEAKVLDLVERLMRPGILVFADTPSSPRPDPDPQEPPRIENVALNLTEACSLRCSFCYHQPRLALPERSPLTGPEIGQFLGSIRPLCSAKPTLVILGGEPFLEPQKLMDVAAHSTRHGFLPLVSTNGQHVTPELARAARDRALEVQVSIDGPTTTEHDRHRGPGTFDRAIAAVRTLVDQGAHTLVSMVCHRENQHLLPEFYALADRLGVAEARFIPLKVVGGARNRGPGPPSLVGLVRAAGELFSNQSRFRRLSGRDFFSIVFHTARFSWQRASCGAGSQTVLLSSDGALYPCIANVTPELRFGEIRSDRFDFRRAWERSAPLSAFRKAITLDNLSGGCADCFVRFWCLGGCRGEARETSGRLDAPSPHCEDWRNAIVECFWIISRQPDLMSRKSVSC
ncbi:MAG: radical SAM protein [Candidatus Riflebacteria bacterium]|nr:radical SAM protein [Candidatus Riflebacteria bacterium]